MSRTETDQYPPFAVINRFTTSADQRSDYLERELGRVSEFLRRQPDHDFLVRARLHDRSDVYVQLGYWRAHTAFVNAVRQQSFAERVERISPMMVDTEADQAVSVARVMAPCTGPRGSFGLLAEFQVHEDPDRFEQAATAQARAWLAWPGFGGCDLLRSTLRPGRYVGISWWHDGDDFAAAMRPQAALRQARTVTDAATVRVERTGTLAYERALPRGTGSS